MRLTLVSNHRNLEVRNQARYTYACDGKPVLPFKGSVAPECTGIIRKGETYIAEIAWEPQRGRAVPLMKVDKGKFCVHCALTRFVDVKIAPAPIDHTREVTNYARA